MREKILEYLDGYDVKMNLCTTKKRDFSSKKGFAQSPCARMDFFNEWFEEFMSMNHSSLAGLIYISSQHCDSFIINYPLIRETCRKYGLPVLGMEEGYRTSGFGQISTRIEAFLESIQLKKKISAADDIDYYGGIPAQSGVFRQRMNLVKAVAGKLPLEAIQKTVSNQIEIFTETMWQEPQRIVWTNMVMPTEIFYAAELIPVNMELVAGWLASLGLSRQFISRCEGLGFSSNLCSYHKATIGLIEEGGLPKPSGVAVSSHICDGGPGVARFFASRYGASAFILNIPFSDNTINYHYLKTQYEMLIKWVEEYTGRPIENEKLLEALEYSNKAREYWIKAFEIRKGEPLFPGHLSLRNLFGSTFLFGSRLGMEVAKAYYEQLAEMKDKGGQLGKDGRKRILWIHFAPLYNNKIMDYLESELDCWIVMDITGHIYWPEYDLEKPVDSLVKRCLSHFYLDDPDKRGKLYRRLVKEYSIDGIVHFMHSGCRAIPGASWQVREIADEFGLSYLELAGDCIDPRGFSEEQMRLRLDAFKETLGRDSFVSGN